MILGTYTHGGDIYRNRVEYDFSANVNPLGTPEAVMEAVRASAAQLARYPDPYCDALREKLAALHAVEPAEVLCGNGAAELIFQFVQAVGPKSALLAVPCFSEYEAALRAVDCQPEYHFLRREEGFRLTGAILPRITEKTDVLILCSPNNPTGLVIDRELMGAILDRCRATGTWLMLDECFMDLTDREASYSIMPWLEETDRVFVLRAFTKLYGMAGVRLGYGVSRNRQLLHRMCRFQQPWNVSTPALMAGCAALSCGEFVERTHTLIRTERAFLQKGLRDLGIEFCPGQANYILLCAAPDLGARLLEKGILIRSCANYPGLTQEDYRIAVRTREENQILLRALGELK